MKKLFLGAMALLAAVTLVACGSKKDAYESIKENKKLVVAVSPDYAPFEFKLWLTVKTKSLVRTSSWHKLSLMNLGLNSK